jgi:hypothetical protein
MIIKYIYFNRVGDRIETYNTETTQTIPKKRYEYLCKVSHNGNYSWNVFDSDFKRYYYISPNKVPKEFIAMLALIKD